MIYEILMALTFWHGFEWSCKCTKGKRSLNVLHDWSFSVEYFYPKNIGNSHIEKRGQNHRYAFKNINNKKKYISWPLTEPLTFPFTWISCVYSFFLSSFYLVFSWLRHWFSSPTSPLRFPFYSCFFSVLAPLLCEFPCLLVPIFFALPFLSAHWHCSTRIR